MNAFTRLDNKFARVTLLVSLLCVLCGQSAAQEFKTLKPGIEYAEVRREFSGKAVNINLLRLDLRKVRLDVHHAMDAAIGTEKTSSIAARHGAFAAINAGFFRLDTSIFAGDAAGVLMIDGELLSESNQPRIALEIFNGKKDTTVSIAHLNVTAWLGFADTRFQIKFAGVNRERKQDEIVFYNHFFGATTPSKEPGTEIVFSRCERRYKKNDYPIMCQGAEVRNDTANSPIPANGFVISIAPGEFKEKKMFLYDLGLYLGSKNKNRKIYIRFENMSSNYSVDKEKDIVAGVPQLIKNGKIDITWEQEKSSKAFVETRHPRTAVAKLKDGKFLMITVDGRSEASAGIDLYDVAAYLLELGATDAMNLDGGGSTTMFVDGKIVNHPSDKEGERKVSDAILVTLRKRSVANGDKH